MPRITDESQLFPNPADCTCRTYYYRSKHQVGRFTFHCQINLFSGSVEIPTKPSEAPLGGAPARSDGSRAEGHPLRRGWATNERVREQTRHHTQGLTANHTTQEIPV